MAAPIEFISETGSTNADLIARIADGERLVDQHWLIAGRQTAGKGRRGRAWLDAPGNFTGSVAVRLAERQPGPATLSLVAALAVYEAIIPLLANPQELALKWPNDVLLRGAKLCGILLEREGDYAVIGVGANLAAAPLVTGRTVAALAQSGPAPSHDRFVASLSASMATELARWREYGFEPIRNRWLAAAHPPGTPLRVTSAAGAPISGRFDGLSPDGALLLRLEDGSTHVMQAGDVELEAH